MLDMVALFHDVMPLWCELLKIILMALDIRHYAQPICPGKGRGLPSKGQQRRRQGATTDAASSLFHSISAELRYAAILSISARK